eukprot:TRINITY_DN6627_c4_g1_i1.p1 TRINITY_DN6627_c4_g1~~TRINITY_DN6627_c4_g1_i1.p1  ORF type:complete len:311 (-),score=66.49 TRINITY_DN6627_c4_g1_i1:70-930(-)
MLAFVPLNAAPAVSPDVLPNQRAALATRQQVSQTPWENGRVLAAATAVPCVAWLARQMRRSGNRTSVRQAHVRRNRLGLRGSDAPPTENYVALRVETPKGETLEVEVRLSHTVEILKSMIQLEIGVPEAEQELIFDGKALPAGARLEDCQLREGSCLSVKYAEGADEIVEDEVPEGELRVYCKCEIVAGKTKKITVCVPKTSTVVDLKEHIWGEFCDLADNMKRMPPDEFGLFKLKYGNIIGQNGNQLRWLKRDEMIKEKGECTVEESTLEPDDELVFASLYFLEY